MEPYTSVYAWPDGKTYTCFVFEMANQAVSYSITGELALAIYPNCEVTQAVRKVAINRFYKREV